MRSFNLSLGLCLGIGLGMPALLPGADVKSSVASGAPASVRLVQAGPATAAPAAPPAAPVGPYWAPGGDIYSGTRIGSPYYWSPQTQPGAGVAYQGYAPAYSAPAGGWGGYPVNNGYGAGYPGYGGGYGMNYGGFGGYGMDTGGYGYGTGFGYGAGGFGGGYVGNPYVYHFGPGFHRAADYGYNRFPYYSYRRPWYFPGHPSYNRDTNYPW